MKTPLHFEKQAETYLKTFRRLMEAPMLLMDNAMSAGFRIRVVLDYDSNERPWIKELYIDRETT